MSLKLFRAAILFGAIALPFSGKLCAHAAKVALGTELLFFRVRVYNDEGIQDGTLSAAQTVADGVLRNARLQVIWQNCTVANPNRDSSGCDMHTVRIDLILYLVFRLEDHAPNVDRSALGYSIIPDDGTHATMAYVCYGRVEKIPSAFSAGELLGLAIAHEIGHLLLGTNSHSNSGLMRQTWQRVDLETKDWNAFKFTSEQVSMLRAAILVHMTPEK